MELMCEMDLRNCGRYPESASQMLDGDNEEDGEYDSNRYFEDISFMFVSFSDIYNEAADSTQASTPRPLNPSFVHNESSLTRLRNQLSVNNSVTEISDDTGAVEDILENNFAYSEVVEVLDVSSRHIDSAETVEISIAETVARAEGNVTNTVDSLIERDSVMDSHLGGLHNDSAVVQDCSDHVPKPETRSEEEAVISISSSAHNGKMLHRSNRKLRNKGRVRKEGKWKRDSSSTCFQYITLSERLSRLTRMTEEQEVEDMEAEYEEFQKSLMQQEGSVVEGDDIERNDDVNNIETETVTGSKRGEEGVERVTVSDNQSDIDVNSVTETSTQEHTDTVTVSQTISDTTTVINTVPYDTPSQTSNETRAVKEPAQQDIKSQTNRNSNSSRKRRRKSNISVSMTSLKTSNAQNSFISRDIYKMESAYDLISHSEHLSTSSVLKSIQRLLPRVQTIDLNIAEGRLRKKKKWKVEKAREQVKTKYCKSMANSIHGRSYYVHHRVFKLMPLEPREVPTFSRRPPKTISKETMKSLRQSGTDAPRLNKYYGKKSRDNPNPTGAANNENPAVRRNAIGAHNADADLPTDILNILIALQDRDLSPEDYELLLRLDERVKPKTLTREQLKRLHSELIEDGSSLISGAEVELCAVCMERYEAGQSVKRLPCSHRFHADCIDDWLSNSSTCCPLDGVEVNL